MAQAWGTMCPMVRTTDPTTSRGYMQPPSMPHTMPSTTAAETACSSERARAPRMLDAPA